MAALKLSGLSNDKPVKLSIELPGAVHRDLVAYAGIMGKESGSTVDPARLVAPMLARFMATDRGFVTARRGASSLRSNSILV